MSKKSISKILICAMLISILPKTNFAEEEKVNTEAVSTNEKKKKLKKLKKIKKIQLKKKLKLKVQKNKILLKLQNQKIRKKRAQKK